MPQTFKALTSILAWILWIAGLVTGISTLVLGIIRGHLFAVSPPTMEMAGEESIKLNLANKVLKTKNHSAYLAWIRINQSL